MRGAESLAQIGEATPDLGFGEHQHIDRMGRGGGLARRGDLFGDVGVAALLGLRGELGAQRGEVGERRGIERVQIGEMAVRRPYRHHLPRAARLGGLYEHHRRIVPRVDRTAGTQALRLGVVIAALGVVFGDIGTSPIYTLQTVFNPHDPHPVPVAHHNVYGVVSLIFWSVMIIVTLTYVTLVMRADNNGEGGIMALITLLRRWTGGRSRRASAAACRGRSVRGRPVLRRQHDHSGDLGAVGRRGHTGDRPWLQRLHRADHRGDHRRAVLRAKPRHRRRRSVLRTGDDPVVHGDRRVRHPRHRRQPRDPQGAVADIRACLHDRPFPHRLLRTRSDRSFGHRRRGAVRRHGALRQARDHIRLARPRASRLHAELLRPGRAGAGRRVDGGRPVLPPDPGVGANSHGVLGNSGHRDRLAGGDHRRVLRGVAGRAARLPAAAAYRAHLGVDHRPDLRAVDKRRPDGRGADPGVRVPQLGGAGIRVRHGGHGNDHDHHHAVLLLRQDALAVAVVGRADRRRPAARGRPDVLRGQSHKARARCMATADHRRRHLHRDDDVAERSPNHHARKGRGRGATARVRRRADAPRPAAGPHSGHGGVPQPGQEIPLRWRCGPSWSTTMCWPSTSSS